MTPTSESTAALSATNSDAQYLRTSEIPTLTERKKKKKKRKEEKLERVERLVLFWFPHLVDEDGLEKEEA